MPPQTEDAIDNLRSRTENLMHDLSTLQERVAAIDYNLEDRRRRSSDRSRSLSPNRGHDRSHDRSRPEIDSASAEWWELDPSRVLRAHSTQGWRFMFRIEYLGIRNSRLTS